MDFLIGYMAKKKIKILFICMHNRFRSKVAEALLKFYDKRGKFEVKSAGMQLDVLRPYVAENVKKVLAEKKVFIENGLPVLVSKQAIEWADKIILVADNVSAEDFPADKTEVWAVSDCSESDFEGIKREIGNIERKISEFLRKKS
jgi:protein-tyrosine-phosphatase